MKFNFIFLGMLLIITSCKELGKETKETFRQTDNYTNIQITEYHYNDNYTNIQNTTTTEIVNTPINSDDSEDNNTIVDTVSQIVVLYGNPYDNLSTADWSAGNLNNLLFFIDGYDQFQLNQTGVTPLLETIPEPTSNFYQYTLDKSYFQLTTIKVNPDNVSDLTYQYDTNLYGFGVINNNIQFIDPTKFTIYVK